MAMVTINKACDILTESLDYAMLEYNMATLTESAENKFDVAKAKVAVISKIKSTATKVWEFIQEIFRKIKQFITDNQVSKWASHKLSEVNVQVSLLGAGISEKIEKVKMNANKYLNHILKKDSPDYDAEMEETLKNDLEAAKEELADALQKNNTTDKYGNITVKNYVDIINKMQKYAREFKDNADKAISAGKADAASECVKILSLFTKVSNKAKEELATIVNAFKNLVKKPANTTENDVVSESASLNRLRASLLIEAADLLGESSGMNGLVEKANMERYKKLKEKNDAADKKIEHKIEMFKKAGYADKSPKLADRSAEKAAYSAAISAKNAKETLQGAIAMKQKAQEIIDAANPLDSKQKALHERINNRAKSQNESIEDIDLIFDL